MAGEPAKVQPRQPASIITAAGTPNVKTQKQAPAVAPGRSPYAENPAVGGQPNGNNSSTLGMIGGPLSQQIGTTAPAKGEPGPTESGKGGTSNSSSGSF